MRDIRIAVVRDPEVITSFVTAMERSPLPRLGEVKVWQPASDEVLFPDVDEAAADYVLFPVALSCLDIADWPFYTRLSAEGCAVAQAAIEDVLADSLSRIPGFEECPGRYVFLQFGDLIQVFRPLAGSVVVKVSAHRRTPRCIAAPYYLEALQQPPTKLCARGARPIAGCRYDFGFRGDASYAGVRQAMEAALAGLAQRGFSISFTHVGYHDRRQPDHLAYLSHLDETRFVLCPRGIAVNSRRFFETLAFGRIPILLADDARLPLDWIIDWDTCAVRVPEAHVDRIHEYVEQFLARTPAAVASAYARSVYERYLTQRQVGNLMRLSLAHLDETACSVSPGPGALFSSAGERPGKGPDHA